jgi:hypothetical protein
MHSTFHNERCFANLRVVKQTKWLLDLAQREIVTFSELKILSKEPRFE